MSIATNGQASTEAEIADDSNRPVGAEARLSIESGGAAILVANAVRTVRDRIADALCGDLALGDCYAEGRVADAQRVLASFVQSWRACLDVLTQGSIALGVDLTLVEIDGRPLVTYIERLNAALHSLRDALANRDYVMLNDVAQFELAPLGQAWAAALNELAAQLDRA